MKPAVAIVGGGFSGAAVAYRLASLGAASKILVFEPRPTLGAGLAYGGDDPAHRVNVPAAFMSMLPDDDGHFTRWLEASGALAADPAASAGEHAFPARAAFGRYVADTLAPHVASGVVTHVSEAVAQVSRQNDGWRLQTTSGQCFRAEVAVVATSHPAAKLPAALVAVAAHPVSLRTPSPPPRWPRSSATSAC